MLGVIVASSASTQTAHVGGVLLVPPALSLRLHHRLDIYRVYMGKEFNESMLKIILNNTIKLFIKTAISISVISNHNSFRALFDKISSVYLI